MNTPMHDVIIVGGGPAGMTAAWHLRDRDIAVLERNSVLGGRLKSHSRGEYWLNLGAHLFPAAGTGSNVRALFEDLGLDTVDVPGSKTAMNFGDKVYDNRRIETYPFTLPLTVHERYQLVRAGLVVRRKVMSFLRVNRKRTGESESSRRARASQWESDRSFQDLLGPLPKRIDAIFRTATRRVPAEMDALSAAAGLSIFAGNWAGKASRAPVNLRGGSGMLGAAVLTRLDDRVTLQATVTSIEVIDGGVSVHYDTPEGPVSLNARHVVVATPAPIARAIVQGLPDDVCRALDSVAYEPFVSMAVHTTETGPMPWDRVYAILTPGKAFNMVFNHANPVHCLANRTPGGSLMCYAGAGLARELLDLPDEEIERRFRRDLHRVYPQLEGLIAEAVVQKWEHGNWYQTTHNTFDAASAYADRDTNVVHLAGDYFAPVSGSVEDAATSGVEAARRVAAALDNAT